jgi:Mg2+ and Co2+ transporter CorA
MEETREKIELFRNYYLVCFRSFDQDPYSPTYLEPLNIYIIVFREGTLSVRFPFFLSFFFFFFDGKTTRKKLNGNDEKKTKCSSISERRRIRKTCAAGSSN